MASDPSETTRRTVLGASAWAGLAYSEIRAVDVPQTITVPLAKSITFMPSGISINAETGEVTIPDGLPLSEAAKAFWQAVRDAFPNMKWRQ